MLVVLKFSVFHSLEGFGLEGLAGSDDVAEFLSILKAGTRGVYFLDGVEREWFLPRHVKRRIATETLNGFAAWLQDRGYAPKTVRVYVGAIQSLAKYYDIPISLGYVNLPPATPVNRKHPWTLAEVGEFVAAMDKSMYRSIATSILQSGLSISDLLALTYGAIKEELEKGITPLCLDLTRKKTGVQFITFLGNWSVKLLKDEWIPQNGLWYKIRKIVGSDREMGIERKSFLEAIDDICKQYGYRRNQLGITCAPRGEFYYRGENYPLSFEMIKKLAAMGTDIVCIEKEGVPRALKDIAKDYPIAFTHSRGFLVEYGVDLINLARETGANVVMITDLDDAGLAMKYDLPEIQRIGVDDEMIQFFGLNKEELQEEYTPGDHFKFLLDKAPEEADLVAKHRIEIDSVLAAAGPRKFFEYILCKLQKLFPTRNYNRAISVAPVMPKEVDELIETLKDYLYGISKNEIDAIKQKLQSWPGLEKVDILEDEIKETILRRELDNEKLKNVIQEIKVVTEKIKSLRGVSAN